MPRSGVWSWAGRPRVGVFFDAREPDRPRRTAQRARCVLVGSPPLPACRTADDPSAGCTPNVRATRDGYPCVVVHGFWGRDTWVAPYLRPSCSTSNQFCCTVFWASSTASIRRPRSLPWKYARTRNPRFVFACFSCKNGPPRLGVLQERPAEVVRATCDVDLAQLADVPVGHPVHVPVAVQQGRLPGHAAGERPLQGEYLPHPGRRRVRRRGGRVRCRPTAAQATHRPAAAR